MVNTIRDVYQNSPAICGGGMGVATILLMLSEKYGIKLDHTDATPRNLKNIEALAALVGSYVINHNSILTIAKIQNIVNRAIRGFPNV